MKLRCLCLIACLGAAASAQRQIDQIEFVEVAGAMEFSGQMIAKPVQAAEWRARGLHPQDQMESAVELLEQGYAVLFHEHLVDHYIFAVPEGSSENEVANQLMATGLFEWVEPDWTLYPIECPDDSRFNSQWHHEDGIMQSCDAWDLHTGNPSVTVGICDTGIQTSHPDLQLHRQEGYNAVNRLWESQGGDISNVHPHGTQTTGCAAANGDNGTGVAGVGWNLSHRMMRVSNSSGGSSNSSTLTHAALTSIGAGDKVANVSYSGVNSNSVRSTATQIKNMGGLLTWSAGNDGRNLNWGDRDNDDVIVVGATTGVDRKSGFSAFGRSVDLAAPGSNVYTTSTGSGYGAVSGTSFSAPLTAGLIALIWSYDPSLTPDEVEFILKNGCDDLGDAGVDDTFGYGRINSFNSLVLVDGGGPTYPFSEQFEDTELNTNVWGAGGGGEINGDAENEPSDPYSLNLDGTDSIESLDFDLTVAGDDTPYLSFYSQHRGVENGESLVAEYRDFFGNWVELETIVSDGTEQSGFAFHIYEIPILGQGDAFRMRFTAQGSDGTDDWFIDDISIAPFEGNSVPFLEEFASTDLTDTTWESSTGEVNGDASNEPSAPYSLNLDGSETATTRNFLLAGADFPTYVSFFVQHVGVDDGETLTVEYVDISSNWATLTTFTSDGDDQGSFEFFQDDLLFDAYHDEFQLRFTAGGSDSSDNWYIDDIRIGDEFTPPDDCVADFNGDGTVNTLDVIEFLNAYTAGDPGADINGDGSINTLDVIEFLNAYTAGCP